MRGNHPSGLKGFVRAAVTKLPLENVAFQAVSTGEDGTTYTATSDEDGRYELVMASGVYDVEVNAPGYQPLLLSGRKIEVGVKHRLNLVLEAMEVPLFLATKELLDGLVSQPKATPTTNGVYATAG